MRTTVVQILGGIVVIVVSFIVTSYVLNWWSGNRSTGTDITNVSRNSTIQPGPAVMQESTVADLPPPTVAGMTWLGIEGLNVQAISATSAVAGQPTLQLIAVPTHGAHTLAGQISGLQKNQVYRITAWVKPVAGANFEIEAGDHAPTGASYGTGIFDLTKHKQGGTAQLGSAPGPQDWQIVWIDLPTSTGQLFFNTYILNDAGSAFTGDGRLGISLGGVTIEPQG